MKTIQQRIKQHQECIEVLEGIQVRQNRIESLQESLKGYPGLIASCRADIKKELDRLNNDITMLEDHLKVLNNVN